MNKKRELLNRLGLTPYRYEQKGKTTLIDTKKGRFVLKEKGSSQVESIYQYLKSRGFLYFPEMLNDPKDEYELMRYIEEVPMPKEQKMSDLVDLVSLLHRKTSHYVEISEDEYKKLYEEIKNNLNYLKSYYEDYLSYFESNVIMSPSEYLFCRNSTTVFSLLSYAENELEEWFHLVKEKRKQRHVVLHNHLSLDHFIRGEKPYFISFEKAKFDINRF